MPTAILSIDASPLAALARRLGDVDADRREALEAIGEAWVTTTRERFKTGTAPDGTPWKPSLRVQRKGGQTLVLDRHLETSIHAEVQGDSVLVGTDRVYGRIHQFGGTIQRKGAHAVPLHLPDGRDLSGGVVQIPARPYLGANAGDHEVWAEILEGFLEEKVGGAA